VRTVHLKVVADEEFIKRTSWILDIRRWVYSSSRLFERSFNLIARERKD
jgi:hypothetical protein